MEVIKKIQDLLNEPYFKEIFNGIADGILIADGTGKVIWLNTAVLSRIDLTEGEIIGQNLTDLENQGVFKPSITKIVLEKKAPLKGIQSSYTQKNKKTPYITSGYPVFNEHGEIEAVVTHSQYVPGIVESMPKLEEAQTLLKRYSEEIRKMQFKNKIQQGEKYYMGKSPSYLSLLEKIDRVSITESTILITGETGVGKSMLAKRLHELSDRHLGPFVEVNCGAIPESLIESELFGYEKAAFTGASTSGKAGLIKMANAGTLFLDEIGELPTHLQVKFLQFLQEKTFLPIGATKHQTANVRIITATNRNLLEEVNKGTFRSDLYYRLNVLPLHVPSLKERPEDIVGLLKFNLDKYNNKHDKSCYLSPEVIKVLQNHDWPGNIRELENLIERFVLINPSDEVRLSDLPSFMNLEEKDKSIFLDYKEGESLTDYVENIEKSLIIEAYDKYKTTRKTAEQLGITQSLLMRRLKKYSITK